MPSIPPVTTAPPPFGDGASASPFQDCPSASPFEAYAARRLVAYVRALGLPPRLALGLVLQALEEPALKEPGLKEPSRAEPSRSGPARDAAGGAEADSCEEKPGLPGGEKPGLADEEKLRGLMDRLRELLEERGVFFDALPRGLPPASPPIRRVPLAAGRL